ncbi:MAG: TonB-dependent receptor [Weeksellaceae bacterium]|nr:TonB-dependent receptor [Weeksellaceae bacterium]
MKTLLKSILIFTLIFSQSLFAQTITKSTFNVKGECGMCKERIETTAKKSGAVSANWNAETQQLEVQYDESKVSADALLKKIAEVGHDNEKYAAPNEVYENLPGCCLYERTPSFLKTTENTVKPNPTAAGNQFFVKGNCGSCKARIEKAATDAGADTAVWDSETQTVVLNFDPGKTSAAKILEKIAEVGHDNEKFLTKDEVYKSLPDCCLYDRELPFGVKSSLVHSDEVAPKKDYTQHADHYDKSIEEVQLVKREEATALSKKSAGLTFNIGQKELLKAACCNLSESFETNATVDVSFSNAVTGTKQLKMLGLDQKYTSLTKELLPEIRGLASAYGLNFIPGRWIGGIQLTKGGSTVTNGYESITGQINTELLKFGKTPETSLNVFADVNSRTEMNVTHTSALNDKWNQSILLHGNGTLAKMDYNEDGFLDQPTGTQLNAAYLINYNDLDKSGWATHFGINFLQDKRTAGQVEFKKTLDQSEQNAYGVGIDISRFQVWNKTGHIFKGKPYQSLGWMNQFTYHQQDSFFGFRDYFGKQNTFYSNLIFESILGNTNHKYKTGASFLYDQYNEDYLTQNHNRTETVPGLFFEYTHTGTKYTLVAGARADFHNLAGTQFTPRLNFKYDFTPKTILRLSAGKGFRTANIFAENQQYFASNRQVEILGNGGNIYNLKPEIAWNYGASLQQEFQLFNKKATLVADFFRTDFQDQVLADLDVSPQKIVFYNLDGKSFANSFQTQLDFSPLKNLDLRLAYKYYDVQAEYLGGTRAVPFMAKNRGFFNASYATEKNAKEGFWSFDTTLQYVGKQRLPDMSTNPVEFQLPASSDPYVTLNAQIARDFSKNVRLYAGGENLTSFTQDNPIIDAANPLGNYFDGGMVYAPIMPANFYVGVDLKF